MGKREWVREEGKFTDLTKVWRASRFRECAECVKEGKFIDLTKVWSAPPTMMEGQHQLEGKF